MKIIIDPGHGGTETGAVAFGLLEKDLNLVFAQKLASNLENLGYDIDRSILNEKYYDSVILTDTIKASGATLCISCHNNSFNGVARGFEVIHSIHSDGTLSNYILNEVGKTGFPVRRAYSRESSSYPGSDFYFVIRQTYPIVETIIVEFGFMDNVEDFNILTDPSWQDRLTGAVAAGIKQYMPPQATSKTSIIGSPLLYKWQLKRALMSNNPSAEASIVDTYYKIAKIYGIKADLAFLQAMLETNWLKFTGVVKPDQNNFAGLGATGGSNPGERFPSVEAGVEAHIQHLYAYSTTSQLPPGRVLYDTRFALVVRGSATHWEDLNGKWAVPGTNYGENIVSMQKAVNTGYPPDGTIDDPDDNTGSSPNHWAKQCNDELLQTGLLQDDHSLTLDKPASEGMVICLVNRLRRLLNNQSTQPGEPAGEPHIHWAKQCNDELLQAGLLDSDHNETLDNPASEGMVICLINRLRKESAGSE